MNESRNSREPAQGLAHAATAWNDKISPPAFFRIRHLTRQDGVEFFPCHAGPSQHPRRLNARRRRDNNQYVATHIKADLEQKRNIEDRQRHAPRSTPFEEIILATAHQRMNDGFQPFQRTIIAEDPLSKRIPVNRAIHNNTGERRIDRCHQHERCRRPGRHS